MREVLKRQESKGGSDASNYEHVTYEGYGPNGTAIIVDALTDNKNRTASNVRNAFQKEAVMSEHLDACHSCLTKKEQIIVAKEVRNGCR